MAPKPRLASVEHVSIADLAASVGLIATLIQRLQRRFCYLAASSVGCLRWLTSQTDPGRHCY